MINNNLKISVITPSLNQGEFIEENIFSVLEQGYPNFEHIIVDGGSTDNTVNILKKYSHLMWESEQDRGQSHAFNKGLVKASGNIICWLNSDDMLIEKAFHKLNSYFYSHPHVKIVTGNYCTIDETGNFLQRNIAQKLDYTGLLNGRYCVQQPSTFFRREVFDTIGMLDESYHYAMDHEFWIRALKKYEHFVITEDLALFRKYSENKTSSSEIKFINEIFKSKLKHNGKIFVLDNLRLIFMYVKEPFKRIPKLRKFVRKIKGANPDYTHYN
ncbi:glycosyltransferase family 2 protein [Candidatus Neomarinimicrobiota bacterium]